MIVTIIGKIVIILKFGIVRRFQQNEYLVFNTKCNLGENRDTFK